MNNIVSTNNSSSTTLAADGVFTGTGENISEYNEIQISYRTDVLSATDGIILEFSKDNATWVEYKTYTTTNNIYNSEYNGKFVFFTTNVRKKYFRVIYTNGNTAQNSFKLTTSYKYENSKTSSSDILDFTDNVKIVRMGSDYKRDIAMGRVAYLSNYIIHGTRLQGISDTESMVSSISGTTYIWPQTARRLRIKAGGNVNDTYSGSGAWYVTILGLDSNFNEIIETLVTAGASASSWTTNTFIRVNTLGVSGVGTYSGSNEGDIIVESETDNYELSIISTGHGKSLSSNYTVPKGHSAFITRASFSSDGDHSVTFSGWYRKNSDDIIAPFPSSVLINFIPHCKGFVETKPEEIIKFEEMTDFWMTAKKETGTGNATVSISYDMEFIKDEI